MEKELTLEQRKARMEELVNGDMLKAEMMRKAKLYPKDYASYLRTAEVTDALKVGSDKEGGYLVPDEFEEKLVKKLENKSIVRNIAHVLTTKHLLRVPGVASHGTAAWVEEGGKIEFSDESFYQVLIDAHKCGCITVTTEELLEDAGFSVEDYIIESAGSKMAELEEAAYLAGDGNGKPRGLLLDAQVGKETKELTMDDALDLYFSLNQKYRDNAVWIMNEQALSTLHKYKSAMGRNVWEDNTQNELPMKLLGRTVYVSEGMPEMAAGNAVIAFGDFSFFWIGERGKRSIKRLNEIYADKGMIGFRMTHRVDGKLIVPEAIKTLKLIA